MKPQVDRGEVSIAKKSKAYSEVLMASNYNMEGECVFEFGWSFHKSFRREWLHHFLKEDGVVLLEDNKE